MWWSNSTVRHLSRENKITFMKTPSPPFTAAAGCSMDGCLPVCYDVWLVLYKLPLNGKNLKLLICCNLYTYLCHPFDSNKWQRAGSVWHMMKRNLYAKNFKFRRLENWWGPHCPIFLESWLSDKQLARGDKNP